MKATYLAIALMLGVFAAPLHAAGPAWDNAVSLSAQDSKAKLSEICEAVYNATKESPTEADKLYEAILAQRTTWKASECYAILRAIILALPEDVACNVGTYVRKYRDAKGSAVRGQRVQRASYAASLSNSQVETLFYGMLDALYNASLPEGVADDTVNSIMNTVSGVFETSMDRAFNDIGGNINGVLPTPPVNGVTPTPPPTSPNN